MSKRLLIASLAAIALLWAALPASDNFNRMSGLGANWSPTNVSLTFSIVSDTELDPDWGGGGGIASIFWNADSFANNQTATVTMGTNIVNGAYIGPAVRVATGANTFYAFIATGSPVAGTAYLIRDPSFTVIEGPLDISSLNAGDTLTLEIVGDTLTAKKNGSLVHSESDATYSSGQAGICSGGGDTQITSWAADNIAGVANKKVIILQ